MQLEQAYLSHRSGSHTLFGRPPCPLETFSELLRHGTASAQCRHRHQQQRLCALQVLVLNLRSEMGALMHNHVDDCSDVLLNLPDLNVSAVAHNEDMTTDAANHTYFVHAQQVGRLVSAYHICLALSRRKTLLPVFRGPLPSSRKLSAHQWHPTGALLWDSVDLVQPRQTVTQQGACKWVLNLSLCRVTCNGQPTPMQASCPPRPLVSTRQASASP